MKYTLFVIVLFAQIFSAIAQSKSELYAAKIKKFQSFYNQQNADSIYGMFSEKMRTALPLDKTKEMLTALNGQIGKLNSYSLTKEEAEKNVYTGNFEKTPLSILFSLNEKSELAGLLFQPVKTDEEKTVNADGKSPSNFIVTTKIGDSLFGTLTMPPNNPKPNIVLIIAGSGTTDRNCNQSGMRTDAFKMLADSLQKAGIASLRYDKRGVGESFAAAGSGTELKFDDFVNDAQLFVKKIKSENRFGKVFVAGHSEGSLTAMLLATKEKIDGYISIAGAGENIANIISRQVKTSAPKSGATADSILGQLKKGKTVKVEDENLKALFHPNSQPFLISWMAYEPQEEIKKLNIPILILQGNTDLQVLVSDAENLRKAKPDAKYYIIDGMNHVLKNASSDRNENLATYNKPEHPIDSDLCTAIIQFCK